MGILVARPAVLTRSGKKQKMNTKQKIASYPGYSGGIPKRAVDTYLGAVVEFFETMAKILLPRLLFIVMEFEFLWPS
jgi:hypothetical protein